MNFRDKWLSSICCLSMVIGLASCAEGFESDETFTAGAGVKNAQLEAPQLSEDNLTVQINADGSESVDVSWPVVYGAGGYLANVIDVTNPNDHIYIVKDSIIDGCHFSFPRTVDTEYEISVSTMGNEKLNNKASVDASVISYSTFVPATLIPSGQEISAFIADALDASEEGEVAFELEAGGSYTLTGQVDCQLYNVTIRGNQYERPLLAISGEGIFVTQAGLTIKHINIDMSDAPVGKALISMSQTPNEKFSTENVSNKANDSNVKDGYVCTGSVAVESCNIRNIPSRLFMTGDIPWSLTIFRVEDCVVQINKKDTKTFISLDDNSSGAQLIKTLTFKNSTFYNISSIGNAYFIRYANKNYARPAAAFGTGATSEHLIENCTFCSTFNNKNWGNNMPEQTSFTVTLNSSILYDISRADQWLWRAHANIFNSDKNNVAWGGGYDDSGNAQDVRSEVSDVATVEDPNFKGPINQMFNLDETLGGVSFDPQLQLCHEKKIGDPRWLE